MNSLPQPTLLAGSQPSIQDTRLKKLVNFLGLEVHIVDITSASPLSSIADHTLYALVDARAIVRGLKAPAERYNFIDNLRQKSKFLFVFGFSADPEVSAIACAISNKQILGCRSFTGSDLHYDVSRYHPEIMREFSGLSFGPVQQRTDSGFIRSPQSTNLSSLVSVDGSLFYGVVKLNGCVAFLVGCDDIIDINETTQDVSVPKYFSRLFPTTMFLRSVFKGQCWHNKHHFANLLIDDPLLRESYGHLTYRDLVSMTHSYNFATTIAFIPWNRRRTEPAVAALFRQHADTLSLCVHGCDHTAGEFGTSDLHTLRERAALALERMDKHQDITGIPYSKVMVFPQGRFSLQALEALRTSGYVAAVNSTATPWNGNCDVDLSVADFLRPAITAYGLPLFLRRYPGPLEGFAFDLFFGKPLLVVEHHDYFKDGGKKLLDLVTRLNSLARLEWTDLETIVMRSYLERELSGMSLCKTYAHRQVIQNEYTFGRQFVINHSTDGRARINDVLVNGQSVAFERSDSNVLYTFRIPPRASLKFEAVYATDRSFYPTRSAVVREGKVWIRRMLSEFRDNVLSRNDLLLASVNGMASHLFRPIRTKSTIVSRTSSSYRE